MTIRLSRPSDIYAAMPLYDEARRRMRRAGNEAQWVNGYPQEALIMKDIEEGVHYMCEEDGVAVAVFTMIAGDDPTYTFIEGQWLNDRPYCTIHRIASNGRRHGVLHEVLQWAAHHTDNLRIDTHEDNLQMQHLLEKEGFHYCGIIYVADGTPRRAYQKTLIPSAR